MRTRRSSRSFVFVLLTAAALLLYPLSLGPVYWVCSDGQGRLNTELWPVQAALELYAPLVWLRQEGPEPIQGALAWYLTLWGAP